MVLTDTHTHLYLEEFSEDLNEVVNRAFIKKVTRLFLPSICYKHYKSMLNLKNKFPDNIFLMSGLHPCYANENYEFELDQVKMFIDKNDIVAVGEIGIDLYWDKTYLKEQQDAFRFQIRLAIKNDLPIVIHCREAFDEIFEILNQENCDSLRGVFHCFTGDLNQAKKAISLGFLLGIGGVVTFKNGGIDKFLNQIDLNHIVLETDSPYLAPVPFRGKRNESSYIIYVLEKLSELYKIPKKEIALVTTNNAKKMFSL